jgi:ABC-type antimicrobial peptide transport system permease subunit
MVMRRALVLAIAGEALGFCTYLAVHRLLATVLFGITSIDSVTLASAIAVLLIIALGSSCLPARQATRIDPVSSVREV